MHATVSRVTRKCGVLGITLVLLMHDDFSGYVHAEVLMERKSLEQEVLRFTDIWKETSPGHALRVITATEESLLTKRCIRESLASQGIRMRVLPTGRKTLADQSIKRLMAAADAMMKESEAPKHLWDDALRHAVKVSNRLCLYGKTVTPLEMLTGKDQTALLMKQQIFGSYALSVGVADAPVNRGGDQEMRVIGYDFDTESYLIWEAQIDDAYYMSEVCITEDVSSDDDESDNEEEKERAKEGKQDASKTSREAKTGKEGEQRSLDLRQANKRHAGREEEEAGPSIKRATTRSACKSRD